MQNSAMSEEQMFRSRQLRFNLLLEELDTVKESNDVEAMKPIMEEIEILDRADHQYFYSGSRLSEKLLSAAQDGLTWQFNQLLDDGKENAIGALLFGPCVYSMANTIAKKGSIDMVEHVMKNENFKLALPKCANFLSIALDSAIIAGRLEMVEVLVQSGAVVLNNAIVRSYNVKPEIMQYLVEHEESGVFYGCGADTLLYAVMHESIPLVNLILGKRLDYAAKGAGEGELLSSPGFVQPGHNAYIKKSSIIH